MNERIYNMRIISLDAVTGKEILAKDIVTSNDLVLMTAGSVMKIEYVKRLKDLNVEYVYVEDEIGQGVNLLSSLEIQIQDHCQEAVRDILINYSYHNDSELIEIKQIADKIINEIMREPEVIYNLSSIRDRSISTYSHSINVCALSVILALKLKLSKSKIKDIAIGCLLHDIGYTYISFDYSNLKMETCTEKERRELKKHVLYGYTAVEKMEWLSQTSKDIIISHHERLDGSGYPFHLKEKRIKIGSKIAAVCDEFDSKVYGNITLKMKVHEVIDYIMSNADVLFDFNVVKAFIDSVAAYPTGTLVITNENETGIVLKQNSQFPTRPVIRIIRDKDGKKPKEWIEKDLTKELTVFIRDSIID